MRASLKIVIFDGSFKTTTFINRLAQGLMRHNDVYIVGFNEELPYKLRGIRYVGLGSNQNKTRFALTSLGWILKSKKWNLLLSTCQNLMRQERRKLQLQNLHLAMEDIKPDVIHVQWLSLIPRFEEMLMEQKYPIVISQLGYQNNVRPFVESKNFKYLKQWFPKITAFHSVSQAVSLNSDKIWSSPRKIQKVIYMGMPLREWPFSQEFKKTMPLQLISVGRSHWIKGYEYAMRCCKFLKEHQFPFHYTIIGGARNEELQFMRFDMGLEDEVSFTGQVSQLEVKEKMQSSHLMLLPSIEEGVPNVVVEAMAIGLPVIATNCGGLPELIEDDINGWLVPRRDPAAMAQAVIRFSQLSEEDILRIRRAARKKVEEQHNEEKMIEEMESLYNLAIKHFQNSEVVEE